MTLTFVLWPSNSIGFLRLLRFVFRAKFRLANCSGSWVIVRAKKKTPTKTILPVATADSKTEKCKTVKRMTKHEHNEAVTLLGIWQSVAIGRVPLLTSGQLWQLVTPLRVACRQYPATNRITRLSRDCGYDHVTAADASCLLLMTS